MILVMSDLLEAQLVINHLTRKLTRAPLWLSSLDLELHFWWCHAVVMLDCWDRHVEGNPYSIVRLSSSNGYLM